MKKVAKLFAGASLTVMAFASALAFGNKNYEIVERVSADSTQVTLSDCNKSGHTFFIDMSGFKAWVDTEPGSNDIHFAIYFFNSSGNAWTKTISRDEAKGSTDAQGNVTKGYIIAFEVPQLNSADTTWTSAIAVRLKSNYAGWGEWDANVANQTNDVDISGSTNSLAISNWGAASASTVQYGLDSGTLVYVNYNHETWWNNGQGNDNFNYLCFFNPLNGTREQLWAPLRGVVKGSGDDKLLEFVVPGSGKTFATMIAVRCITNYGGWNKEGSADSNVNNQSPDMHAAATSADKVENALAVHYDNAWDTNQYSYNISDSARAEMYGRYFTSQLTCGGRTGEHAGEITSDDGPTAWSNVRTEYNDVLLTSVKNIVKAGTYSVNDETDATTGTNGTSQAVAEAVRRYDYIVGKYYRVGVSETYNDFMSRNPTPIGSGSVISTISNNNESTQVMFAVITMGVVSALSLSAFLVLKKKRIK